MKSQPLRRWWCAGLVVGLAFGLGGCATAVRRRPSATDSLFAATHLAAAVEDYWRYQLVSRPDLAVRAGNTVTVLPDPTQYREKIDAQFARAGLAALDEVFVEALTEDAYVTWMSLRWELEALSGWAAFHWTKVTDLSPGISVFDRSIEILNAQNIRDVGAGQRFVGLVTRVADLAEFLKREYEERARRDIHLSRAATTRAIAYLRDLITPAEASPFWLPRTFRVSADTGWHVQLAGEVADVIVQRVNPSLDSLAAFLEKALPLASDTLGLSRLPGGAAHYATLLRYRTTVEVTPQDAHAIGLREAIRIAGAAAVARREAGLPVNRDSLRATLARDSNFVLDTRQSVAERAAKVFHDATKNLDTLFLPLPSVTLTIGVVAPELEATSPLAVYVGPTFTQPAARYLLNIAALESRSTLVLAGLVLGDLMPGLHLQQGTQFDNAARRPQPGVRAFRTLVNHDGFVKGWQSYALEVADSLSRTLAPWQRFGLRLQELAAACGLVVDTGINALGWTREQALEFLRAYLPDDDAVLQREYIDVASESPGTLAAAALGARELRGLRRWAMRELGDRFSLGAFHREVLRVGSVPLPVLGSHLERWIWEQKTAARPDAGVRR